eukprot:s3994_g4.t1
MRLPRELLGSLSTGTGHIATLTWQQEQAQVASSSDDAAGSCNDVGNGVVVDERRLWQHRNVIVDALQFPPAEAEYRREHSPIFVIDKWQQAGTTT